MVGYQKVAEMYGMKDTRCLRKWVKQYQDNGENFFEAKKVAKKEFMYKTPESYEDKILYLQAENAYLKELLGITAEKVKKKKNTKQSEN
jgi:transposase-like protein